MTSGHGSPDCECDLNTFKCMVKIVKIQFFLTTIILSNFRPRDINLKSFQYFFNQYLLHKMVKCLTCTKIEINLRKQFLLQK